MRLTALVWLVCGAPVLFGKGVPVVERAAGPDGPWASAPDASVVEVAGGRYQATAALGGDTAFFRIVEPGAEAAPCILAIDRVGAETVRLEFAAAGADTDGDGVPDCADACPGGDDRADADGDGSPDACDNCPGHDDRPDADTDGVPDGCDLCGGLPDWVDENGNGTPDCAEAPPGMAWIGPGLSAMGDTFAEGASRERPVHTIYVGAFYMDRHEVTKALWDDVHAWAVTHGYAFHNLGGGKGPNHPVQTLNWTDAAKWCNARSEKEGLTPVYRTAQGQVFRVGGDELRNDDVLWDGNGYRLPTEAEWEKAARGALAGRRFPGGDTIAHGDANYMSSADYPYDVSPTRGYHPDYNVGGYPATSPVGSFPPNGYGLYDMAGNVWEWCWDWYQAGWYARAEALMPDPRGPAQGSYRVIRGGAWTDTAVALRCADRTGFTPVHGFVSSGGFRCVRGRR